MKRARQSPSIKTPFNYSLVAMQKNSHRGLKWENYSVTVTLSIPEEDDECPLTLDLISESKLSFLPESPFLLDRPQHCKLTLPCGHSFSALTLIYNYCKNYMVCPCCRAGKEERMDVSCLPRHLRDDIRAHLRQVSQEEQRAQQIEDMIAVAGIVSVLPYHVLAVNNNLSMQIEFYTITSALPVNASVLPTFVMATPLQAGEDGMQLAPRSDLRSIANIANLGVNAVRISIYLTMRGTGRVAIDATPITQLPQVSDENTPRNLTIPGITSIASTFQNGFEVIIQLRDNNDNETPPTRFCLTFSQSAASPHLRIQNIIWHAGTETLAIMSNNSGLAAML